jgi:Zn-finger nucleic acid-binding protein
MRSCPQCKQPMRKSRVSSVEVDECPSCKGLWFDDEEQALAKDQTRPDLFWLDLELWKHREHFHASRRRLLCPDCAKPLVGIEYGAARVVVDACAACHGIWLDKGEFQRILEALLEETSRKDVGDYLRETIEEARELLTGNEAFLTEWQDLRAVLKLLQLRFFVEHPRLLSLVSGMPPF